MEYLLLGVAAGTVAGLIPGIGIFATLLLCYPWVLQLSVVEAFTFYLALATTTQYIGSVSATVFGVPGEASSLPAVTEGNSLFKAGRGSDAISGAALGSLLAGLLTVFFISLASPLFPYIHILFTTYIQATVLFLVCAVIIFTSNKNIFISLALASFGFYLGSIGCDSNSSVDICHVPVPYDEVYSGLPLVSVLGALFVFPQMLKQVDVKEQQSFQLKHNYIYQLKLFINNIYSSLRGFLIGFCFGFTPGASTVLSSNAAHRAEIFLQKDYKKGNYKALVGAESANNSAAFTTLMPLFLLGLPLTGSEALFYDLMSIKGFTFNNAIDVDFFFNIIIYNMILINILAFLVAWPFAKYISFIYKIPLKLISIFVFVCLLYVMWLVGGNSLQSWYYVQVFFVLLPLGYLLRKFDLIPLVFVFILQDKLYFTFLTSKDLLLTLF